MYASHLDRLIPRSLVVFLSLYSRELGQDLKTDNSRLLSFLATNQKVAGSIPDEVIFFFLIYLILPAAPGPEVYSASNINEYLEHKNNNVSGE
jgi:hypothetical protein